MRYLKVALRFLLAFGFLGGPGFVHAGPDAQEVEEDNSLASRLVTPHVPWGKGTGKARAEGAVRTLFFIYTGPYEGKWEDTGTRVRQAVELQQRFNLPGDAVLFCGKGKNWVFHGLRQGKERAERLLEKPYQLYVIGGFSFDHLPPKFQYLILKQVAEGAGLLCCGQPAKDFMVPKRKIKPTPGMLTNGLPVLDEKAAGQTVTAYRLKKGRGVWLKYRAHGLAPFHQFSWRGLTEYEYWMMLIGRAALWAAGKESPVAIEAISHGKPASLSREAPQNAVEASLSTETEEPMRVTVATALRRASDGWKIDLDENRLRLQPGQPLSLKVHVPRVRAGDYFLDVIVKDRRSVLAFGAGNVTVTSEAGIEKVELDRSFVERGHGIRAAAELRGVPPAGSVLQFRLRDSNHRLLWRQDQPVRAEQTRYTATYSADSFATILMRFEAALLIGTEEADMKEAEFTVPKRRHGRFNFVMWDAPMDVTGYYAWRQLQEAGMGVCLLGAFTKGAQPPTLRACDASLAPYSTRILDPKNDKGYMKPVCWNDEPAVTAYVQKIVDNQAYLREQGVFTYSLGDEGVTKGCCVHPACLAAYRRWLQEQYGTIAKLNASWGTNYKSFGEVNLLNPEDNMEIQSRKTCFPRWYDREAFARHNLMQLSRRFVEAYRGLDPDSFCGFEGTGRFGEDYDAILTTNTFYGPYPSIGDDIIRWAYPKDRIRSNWMGYSKTGDALSDAAWRMVMKGMNSIWFWMWSGVGSYRGYLRPTLDFWPATKDLMQEMKPVREGLGDLLLQSTMQHSGIAIFYSLPSASSGQIENSGSFARPVDAHTHWLDLTYELGLDLKYLTSGMLRNGALRNDEFQALLLPMTQALRPDEAELIRRFAENGGTVIADVRPGVFDAHLKPVLPGQLDDLFGIKRTGRGKPEEAPVEIKGAVEGRDLDVKIPKAKADAEVAADTAESLGTAGETPVMFVHRVGKGRAVLLNFAPVFEHTTDPSGAGARELLKALYDIAGVQGVINFTGPLGRPLPRTETRVWRNGDAFVFGLWRHMENAWFNPKSGTLAGESQPALAALPAPRHVYDLRAKKYLGKTSKVETSLRWGRSSFYLALPYKVRGLKVKLSATRPEPGQPFAASISLKVPSGANEKFACWVQVINPEGKSPLWGRRVVLLKSGKARVPLLVAHNDTPGRWKVRVTELFSRSRAEASWKVR